MQNQEFKAYVKGAINQLRLAGKEQVDIKTIAGWLDADSEMEAKAWFNAGFDISKMDSEDEPIDLDKMFQSYYDERNL